MSFDKLLNKFCLFVLQVCAVVDLVLRKKSQSSFFVVWCKSFIKKFVGITICDLFPVYFGPPNNYKKVGFQVTRKI